MLLSTWAVVGHTPVLRAPRKRERLSAIGGLTTDGRLLLRTQEGTVDSDSIVSFLRYLLRRIAGPIVVVWDNASIHRSKRVRRFLSTLAPGRLELVPLPPYAPELNPIELVWGYLKRALGNTVCHTLGELNRHVHRLRRKLQKSPALLLSFIRSLSAA